jgi:serine/threonine protein kinase
VGRPGDDEHGDVGDLIGGRFVLVEPIGRGSFGAVWQAADCENGAAPCALKILFDAHRGDPKKLQRFVQEGKILARLDHPNIARMIAASTISDGDEAFVAMELIDGEPLHEKLETHASCLCR